METKITSQYLTKEQMVLVEDFVDYCVRRFRLQRFTMARIRISICQKVEADDEGNCVYESKSSLCNEVKIKVRHTKNMKKILTVLGHEMVHAKQYLTGQLDFINNKAHWRGLDVDALDYRDQPHEVEAFGLEDKILNDFYKSRKRHQNKPKITITNQ